MNTLRIIRLTLTLCIGALLAPYAMADDIDIFLGTSAGTADAPNIIFFIDNSPNWSRASQHWPDNGGNQGQAELAAISSTLNRINSTRPANVGLAMLTAYAGTTTNGATPGTGGGYIRFGVRDMTNATNLTALKNILAGIAANITDPAEKVAGMANKDEDAGFYEIYKYLSGLQPYTGLYSQNEFADVLNNPQALSAAGQGLRSGFALSNPGAGATYVSPITSNNPCANTYIIYIANNANNSGSNGQAAYEPTVANVSPALPATPLLDTWTDEWTYFLRTNGVVVPAGNNNGAVVTYVLDAYNAQQNVGYSNSLMNAAKMGGGKYYQVGSQAAIANALGMILAEIQAVNSSFASASLPVNSTNRTQDKNQVFIPMFRPDPSDRPLWMGNLKQYQLINLSGSIDLGDDSNPPISAVNMLTGFITPCAQSFWTTDSGTYWRFDIFDSPPAKGTCPRSITGFNSWSDDPDGPIVEKGGVAEVIRKGNNPPTTNTTPTWAPHRTIYTLSGLTSTTLVPFTSTSLGASAADVSLAEFILGEDINDENANGLTTTEVRPSVHGDEVHSRPEPVDYGGTTGVTVYYGSNDGTLRAVDSGSGTERWAFIAPEFYTPAPALPPATPTGFSRLMNDSPLINYFGMQTAGITPTPVAKDYYFDGSIGLYQTANNSSVWIYPAMRRGGRTIYALDVTNPASPQVKWKAGCPYQQPNNTGCTAGMSGIGQTWSTPVTATNVLGYSGPVVIVGGGYDTCEDTNSATPPCSTPNGAVVYVLDANTGVLIKSFSTTRSVAADVALIAVTTPGVVDHAYAVDTGGNIWRIDFASSVSNWVINRVAYTNGTGTGLAAPRKFLFSPALLAAPGNQVYVAVGSGDREHPLQSEYPYSAVVNRFYVYKDNLASTSATNLDDTTTMNDFTYGVGDAGPGGITTGTSCSTAGVLPTSSMSGWFMNLNQNGLGEQTVTSAIIAAGMVAFSTNRPVPATAGTCSTSLGAAYGYWVNLFNASGGISATGAACGGQRDTPFVGGGLPPSPVLATVPVGTQVVTVAIGAAALSGGPSCGICAQQVKPAIVPTRKTIFWKGSGEN